VRAWLVTTARRETLRLLKEGSRIVDLAGARSGDEDGGSSEDPLEQIADTAPLPDALLDDLQQQHRVREALDRLDPRSRQLLELLFLQEEPLPYGEIAARLGIAEGSIGPTRARALEKLRKLMG
jgi:RNA polymerase sigma factor (sigma-70 family)